MPKRPLVKNSLPPPSQSEVVLSEIKDKLHSSAALNGGFDALIRKIDKIEQGQGHLVARVEKIHDAIYDPNEGIFAKLSETKLENSKQISEVDHKLVEVSEWKKYKDKIDSKQDDDSSKFTQKIVTLENSVDTLVKAKNTSWNVIKWLVVALMGGIITLIFKYLEKKLTIG